jgi:hypothetical protein
MTVHRTLLERAAFWLDYEGHAAHVADYDRRGQTIPALMTQAQPILVGWAVSHAKADLDGDLGLLGPMNWLPVRTAVGVYTI